MDKVLHAQLSQKDLIEMAKKKWGLDPSLSAIQRMLS